MPPSHSTVQTAPPTGLSLSSSRKLQSAALGPAWPVCAQHTQGVGVFAELMSTQMNDLQDIPWPLPS